MQQYGRQLRLKPKEKEEEQEQEEAEDSEEEDKHSDGPIRRVESSAAGRHIVHEISNDKFLYRHWCGFLRCLCQYRCLTSR